MCSPTPWLCPSVLLVSLAAFPGNGNSQSLDATVSAVVTTAHTSVYVDEVFDLHLVVRTEGATLSEGIELDGLPDEARLRLEPFEELPLQRSMVGRHTHEVRRYRAEARALRAGSMEFAPALGVHVVTRHPSLTGSAQYETPQRVHVPPLVLRVQDLPPGAPDDFSGAVGAFSLEVCISPAAAAVGEPVEVRSSVSGRGFLEGAFPPRLLPARHFRLYDPIPLPATANGEHRAYSQVVVAQSADAIMIPPVRFTFFDPRAGAFRTVADGPFRIDIRERAPTDAAPLDPSDLAREAAAASARLRRGRTAVWLQALALGCLLLAAGLWVLAGPECRAVRRVYLLAVLAALLTWGVRRNSVLAAEYGRMTSPAKSRFAPSHGAALIAELPPGALVRVIEESGSWLKVDHDGVRGWVVRDAVMRDKSLFTGHRRPPG